jgi:FkbM family methyltransferase
LNDPIFTVMLAALALCTFGLILLLVQASRAKAQLKKLRAWQGFVRQRDAANAMRWRTLYASRAQAQLARAGRTPSLPIKFLSQDGEDRLLWDLLGDRPGGFFIECGAADGLIDSVTYALEAAGWRGLLVEPQKAWADRARANRPHSTVAQTACSAPGGPASVQMRTVTGDDESAGLMASLASVDDQRKLDARGFALGTTTVPCTTMDALLAPLTARVDVLVLDVEGHELEVLKGLSLERYRPSVLLIESINQQDQAIRTHVEPEGYVFIAKVARNLLLVRADEPALADRALELVTRSAHWPSPSESTISTW